MKFHIGIQLGNKSAKYGFFVFVAVIIGFLLIIGLISFMDSDKDAEDSSIMKNVGMKVYELCRKEIPGHLADLI